MPKRISTARGREFGEGVRAALAAAGLSSRRACELLDWDPGKLSDLVNGKGGSTEVELGILLGLCRTPAPERDHLLALFRETDVKGWWQEHGASHPIRPRTWIGHLNIANALTSWQPLMVHGLLQLPDYMRAVTLASANAPVDEADARVEARLAMQEVFRQRLQCTFYIHEQALLIPVGGAQRLSEQLHHLLRMSVRPYITLRMVPTEVGAHAGFGGAFDLLTFDKIQPVVFLDTENSSLIVEAPTSVGSYEKVVASLDRTALNAEESRRRITKLAA